MFDEEIKNIFKSEEFRALLVNAIAEKYVDSKLYEISDESDEYGVFPTVWTLLKHEISNYSAKIGIESIEKSIKSALNNDYAIREIVTKAMLPMIGKLIDEALRRKE